MLKQLLIAGCLSASFSAALAADADFAECSYLFAHGKPPVMSASADMLARPLCFSAFAVMHSGKSRTPIYVAERLNKAMLTEAKSNQRTDKFFADARLPDSERAELDDYKGSGFDRGHMAPAGNMATEESMAQSFSLANMVPQYPVNNREAWANIEKATRKYVMRAVGDVFVITGPVFDETHSTIGPNGVWVPQHLFKLVYDPATKRSWAHWLANKDDARVGKPISYEELVRRTGIEFLPSLK
jgi:endonuclease G